LKQDGAKLSGMVSGAQVGQIEIFDGKVDGDKVSFNVMYNGMTIKSEGVISGDTIKLTSSNDQGGFAGGEATLTRSKTPDSPEAPPASPNGNYSTR
jgi:cytoskeletal protein CcmA (bactofilin family)